MRRKLTLKQIAKEMDVSIATVSKALRDSSDIGLETREKIQAFAKLYNYKPNNIALSLKNRKTKNIGVIIPEIVHHFFTTVVSGVERVANKRGYNVIVCLSDESFDKEVINMEMLASGSIDGFIMSLSKETQAKKDFHHLKEAINQGMPLVLFDRVAEEIYCDKVVIDDAQGTYRAVNHLIDTGCKRIALITTVDYVSVGKLRTQGYLNAIEDAGFEIDENLIIKIEDTEDCEEPIRNLFETQEFDAIFGVNETFAVSAMREAQVRGLKIPEDVSVIGFTDGILSKYSYPRMSTINQHGVEMGEKAAEMLIDKLEEVEEDEYYRTEVVKSSLTIRESTKKIS
ncbi:LacI family DNA-binding transcriptional regulator [Neptunitalea lumnitzerae]|uniref:LacI family transcriptional regulator n=1 Tax=Neptunitalea lumnitzerae TaxID=2965509 RepID=A0ABQ5MGP2_9FLAO|nr:LacI family DNA-binding transcriptional regulator [Neptunitalea sp. Y10]GLB48542.1 LacI family transcriptional regulator [Neptunitalea sp. Y10]